jgi:hypothetical protein
MYGYSQAPTCDFGNDCSAITVYNNIGCKVNVYAYYNCGDTAYCDGDWINISYGNWVHIPVSSPGYGNPPDCSYQGCCLIELIVYVPDCSGASLTIYPDSYSTDTGTLQCGCSNCSPDNKFEITYDWDHCAIFVNCL